MSRWRNPCPHCGINHEAVTCLPHTQGAYLIQFKRPPLMHPTKDMPTPDTYLGRTMVLDRRIHQHFEGTGSIPTRAAVQQHIPMRVVSTWEGKVPYRHETTIVNAITRALREIEAHT